MEFEDILKSTPKEMRKMLKSVYENNLRYLENNKGYFLKILEAMFLIDRKYFCYYKGKEAYFDIALSIGNGQTISQPSTVARMLFLADLKKGQDILEVGTGSGWNAVLISYLVYPGKVVSVERIYNLKEKAQNNINNFKKYFKGKDMGNINLVVDNFFNKKKKGKKYDRVVITAGIKEGQEKDIKKIAKKCLKENGKAICPYQSGPLAIYEKKKGKITKKETKENYFFVPLIK